MSKRRAADRKHLRQSIKRNRLNRSYKSRVRSTLKEFEALGETEKKAASLPAAVSTIDKAVAKRIMHRNKAARIKSRMARQAATEK